MASCIQRIGKDIHLKVQVQPKSSKADWGKIIEREKNQWVQLKTTAPPVDGAANKAVTKFLAKEFKTAKSNIKLIQGDKSRFKIFLMGEVDESKLQAFLNHFCLQL